MAPETSLKHPPRAGERPQTECHDPATGKLIGHSALHSAAEARAIIARARRAQVDWARLPLAERRAAILRVRDHIVARAEELAATISRDNGKTRVDALAAEVVPAAMAATYYARRAPSFLKARRLRPSSMLLSNKRSKVVRVPFGVIGVISPWNYPFSIPFSEVVMALLAGNTVVLKVATQTQLVGRAIESCLVAAELPEGVFSYLNLPGAIAGDLLLEAGVDKLFFTGSVPVGKKLMAKAAETLTPLSLELGGNDPMIVCHDADLVRAAGGAVWGAFQNAGQTCAGIERVYVHRDLYRPFIDLVRDKVQALRVGPDIDHHVDIGAITTKSQLETVQRQLADALDKGATLWAQSECPENPAATFHPPTVLTDVDHQMEVMREETFGPLLGVMSFESYDQAIELANDSNLGLTASVWSKNTRAAERLARRIRAGAVTINDHIVSHGLPETPWGGFKESGIGRTHGEIGFAEMTEPQCIVHDTMPGVKKNMWWHPHGPRIYAGILGLLRLLYGSSGRVRVAGLGALLRVVPRVFRG